MTPPGAKPSLYDRLGGVWAIAVVVDDFIDRIMHNPRLNANPKVDEAHHKVPPAGFKYLVTEMVCWATGGPQKYTGKSMHDSHVHLDITAGGTAIGVATSIGLALTVLIMLGLRATSGSADIGIGNMDVYRPNIDPVALVAIAAVTAVVGVAAAFVPARRAVRMDPLMALRHE